MKKVSSFTLEGSTLTLRLRGENGAEKSVTASIGDAELFHKDLDELIADQYASGVLTSIIIFPRRERRGTARRCRMSSWA